MTADEITRTIDDAWREAEDEMHEYRIRSLTRLPGNRDEYEWEAVAARPGDQHIRVGHGRSPAAAIDSLWVGR